MSRAQRRSGSGLLALAFAMTTSARAQAQVVVAEPESPIEAPFPEGAPPIEVQVVLQLVVDAAGSLESAVVTSRAPVEAPPAFEEAALAAARSASFHPSTRDGRPMRSRVEYVVVFHPPATPDSPNPAPAASGPAAPATVPAPPPALSTAEQDQDYAQVQVHGTGWASPRGLGDLRIKRDLLEASPRQQTSEMLSAAPGFFVDHEDGEGLGNDVYLRGFDLDHGSGIEMRVGNVPINIPTHIQGQGYADANFIIPEVVRSIRVLEGPYDPRQGDAAIVGSAYFDLGVENRGYQARGTYGSFNQLRLLAVAAPSGADEETFAAFAVRKTDGYGENRASQSASANAQYGVDLGPRDHLRILGTAYGVRQQLPGVVRQDDLDAGRIGLYDSYPSYAANQGVQSTRVILEADLDHSTGGGSRFEIDPWAMVTSFRSRQNFSGNVYSSQIDPGYAGLGDLWETTNDETAAGLTSRLHAVPWHPVPWLEAAAEPGIAFRIGHTNQTKSLLDPSNLQAWDRRVDDGLDTLDAGGYIDLDLRLWKRLRVSGGIRADLLSVQVNDALANISPPGLAPPGALPGARRSVQGIAASPRFTVEYEVLPGFAPVFSYGEGFRSLDASVNAGVSASAPTPLQPGLVEGSSPFSKVRSVEAGLRTQGPHDRYTATVAAFETWVGNEVVFEATSGGLTTEGPSLRRGVVCSAVARPLGWLLVSSALSVSRATFQTLVQGLSEYVPDVPPVLFRVDLAAHGTLADVRHRPLTGRVGIGYTYLGRRHLTDAIVGPANNVLNANAALRYGPIEIGADAYNLLALHYADDEQVYTSNWGFTSATKIATTAIHETAAPPLTVLGSVALYF